MDEAAGIHTRDQFAQWEQHVDAVATGGHGNECEDSDGCHGDYHLRQLENDGGQRVHEAGHRCASLADGCERDAEQQ